MSTTTTTNNPIKKIDVNWEKYDVHVIHLPRSDNQPVVVESYKFPPNTLVIMRAFEWSLEDFDGKKEEVPGDFENYVVLKLDEDGDIAMIMFNEIESLDDIFEELNKYLRQYYNIELVDVTCKENSENSEA